MFFTTRQMCPGNTGPHKQVQSGQFLSILEYFFLRFIFYEQCCKDLTCLAQLLISQSCHRNFLIKGVARLLFRASKITGCSCWKRDTTWLSFSVHFNGIYSLLVKYRLNLCERNAMLEKVLIADTIVWNIWGNLIMKN